MSNCCSIDVSAARRGPNQHTEECPLGSLQPPVNAVCKRWRGECESLKRAWCADERPVFVTHYCSFSVTRMLEICLKTVTPSQTTTTLWRETRPARCPQVGAQLFAFPHWNLNMFHGDRSFEYYLPAAQTFRVHWTFSLSAEPIEFQSYYDSPASSEKNGSPGFVGEVKKRFNDHLFITMTKCCFAVNYKGFV